jgi:crossover junction endodeoxyribonuclease RusA
MTERAYMIRLPWPPTKTSPNKSGQGKWREKSEAAKSYKTTCAKECMAQAVARLTAPACSARVTYCPPSNRRIDWDNMAARCKQGFDAVAEAVGIDDGNWWPVISERGPKTKDGCVLVEIYPHVEIPFRGQING